MHILLKNKNTLFLNDFEFKCCVGVNGLTKNKIEGDKKTPIGIYNLGNLFYRKDRLRIINTKLKKKLSQNLWVGVMTLKVQNIIN